MRRVLLPAVSLSLAALVSCGGGGGGGGGGSPPPATGEFVVFAWNDLGMHCLNPSYDSAVILPPYNDLLVQVVRRGSPPEIVVSGIKVEYRIVNNTYSYGKGNFGQFWDNMMDLFGVSLPHDKGLNLVDPSINNGLSGEMLAKTDHFEADGIPVVPIDDSLTRNPYQVAEITVKDAQGNVLAQTRTTIPTSDEFNCQKCHKSASSPSAPVDPYLQVHDRDRGTDLSTRTKAFLCASPGCHISPALGQSGGPGANYLSKAIHGFHGGLSAAEQPACYDCHPGQNAECNRSLRHTAADGNCQTCHGTLAQVAATIASGRTPWVGEPECSMCHGGTTIPEVDTGAARYRDSSGHGGMRCTACHSSPHAMVPSREASDNYQAIQYQNKAVTIGSCGACHGSSKGEGLGEFGEEHGGANGRRSACNVCHTQVPVEPTKWPHAFKWQAR
jgi:hypothetical protein